MANKKTMYNVLSLICLIAFVFAYFLDSLIMLFVINALVMFLILIRAKLSLFSIKCFIAFYILVPVFAKEFYGVGFGILAVSTIPLETTIINVLLFIYLFANLVFIVNTQILVKEKKLYERFNEFSNSLAIIFFVLAIACILIHYPPNFLRGGSTDRFYHLLPGNFWNHLSIILLLFTLPKLNFKKLWPYLPWLFVIFWCLIKKERVDAIGLALVLLIWHVKKGYITYGAFALVIGVMLITLALMGFTRIGSGVESLSDAVTKVIIQSTSSDIAYILNISIRYVKDFGYMNGSSYLSYIVEFIPSSSLSYDASAILNTIYDHPGGIHVLAEPYMNFGVFGVIAYSLIELIIINFVFSRKSKIACIYFTYFIVASFRYCWYGISYLETGVIILIPLCYALYYFTQRRSLNNFYLKDNTKTS